MKVLLANANPEERQREIRALTRSIKSCAVRQVATGAEAISALESDAFQIAFIDAELPDADIANLLRMIRFGRSTMPIVLIGGPDQKDSVTALLDTDGVEFLIKGPRYLQSMPETAKSLIHAGRGGHDTHPALSPAKILHQVLAASSDLLDVQSSSLMIYCESTNTLETRADRGLSSAYLGSVRPRPGESIEGRAVAEFKPLYSGDLLSDQNYSFKNVAEAENLRSALSVPFRVDTMMGVLNLYSDQLHKFSERDAKIAFHLIKLSSLALRSLRLYSKEHYIAGTLQRSHFPTIETRFKDWEVAYRYNVSQDEALLGGDFYDLFEVSGGRRAFVVADVCGKGIKATNLTAMIKHTIRSYAVVDPDPASVLALTHRAFCAYSETEQFVTMFYGLIDPDTGTISYCSAGHPPPLFFSAASNAVSTIDQVHLPLGVFSEEINFSTGTVSFSPGDTILVYTDGLTDCRRDGLLRGELFGEDNLKNLFVDLAGSSVESLADAMLARIRSFSSGKMKDDVAFFVFRLLDESVAEPVEIGPDSGSGRETFIA